MQCNAVQRIVLDCCAVRHKVICESDETQFTLSIHTSNCHLIILPSLLFSLRAVPHTGAAAAAERAAQSPGHCGDYAELLGRSFGE
jgi:hypothetical protein